MTKTIIITTAALLLGAGYAQAQQPVRAIAVIEGCTDPSISGLAVLSEEITAEGVKQVTVSVQAEGFVPFTEHGVHLHETAACEPCSAAAGHFDPGPESNTSPDGNHPFHSGDLINLSVDAYGRGVLQHVTSRVTLSSGPLSLFDADGSAIIIHLNPDSFCPDGEEAGCAGGGREACGIVQLAGAPTTPPVIVEEDATNDVEERVSDGDMYIDSTDIELVDDSSNRGLQVVGLRFINLDIPQGATIRSAYIEFVTDETDSVSTSLVFHGEAADSAPATNDNDFNVSSRPTTSASVNWNNVPPWNTIGEKQQTPDLSPIVQEIVDRPGWSAGNDIMFVITGSGERTAESQNGSAAPLVHIEYTAP